MTCILSAQTGNHSVQATRNGRIILIASLIFQVASFSIFLLVTIVFHIKARRILPENILKPFGTLFMAFYISGTLIVFRSIFRFVRKSQCIALALIWLNSRSSEFITIHVGPGGATGYLFTTEWVLYVFDSVPMLVRVAIFMICSWHLNI